MLLLALFACKSNVSKTEKVLLPPEVTITSPEDGAESIEDHEIDFSATVLDDETLPEDLILSWSSSLDEEINADPADSNGIASFTTDTLSSGEHEITLSATNSAELNTSATITIFVVATEDAPSIELLLPAEDFIEDGETSFFKVSATDPNYSYEDLSLSFISNVAGEFCAPELNEENEGSCEIPLPLGTHEMEFSVENPDGLRQFIEFEYYVLPPSQIDNDLDGYTEEEGDCNDEDPLISPEGTEVINNIDDDCDDLIDDETDIYDDDGDGFSEDDGDCDDDDINSYPDATEVCDGKDQDCNGIIDNDTVCFDDDEDGFTESDGDCDDDDPTAFPNNDEAIDGIDNDCDTYIDEGSEFFDDDGDCYCESTPCYGSIEPSCTSFAEGDCDDANDTFAPNAIEYCDGLDTNCNGDPDDNPSDGSIYYPDSDVDGFGDPSSPMSACEQPEGYVTNFDDCNDAEPLAWTGNIEVCDYADNDCNGLTDEYVTIQFYGDSDGDGYGTTNDTTIDCTPPAGYVANSDDCNDAEPLAWTGADEYCDGVDNNCNSVTDEPNALDCVNHYIDGDGDGFGNISGFQCQCAPDATFGTTDSTDCYDSNPLAYPGAGYQALDRGDGSFDYDCNGTEEQQYPSNSECNFLGCENGWLGYIPSCGQSDDYEEDCSGAVWVCFYDTFTYTQGCK